MSPKCQQNDSTQLQKVEQKTFGYKVNFVGVSERFPDYQLKWRYLQSSQRTRTFFKKVIKKDLIQSSNFDTKLITIG